MMPAARYSYLSSRLVREVAQLGGPVDCLVPDLVAQKLREKMEVANKFGGTDRSASEPETKAERAERASAQKTKERKTNARKRKRKS
jgi:hypothetical protein